MTVTWSSIILLNSAWKLVPGPLTARRKPRSVAPGAGPESCRCQEARRSDPGQRRAAIDVDLAYLIDKVGRQLLQRQQSATSLSRTLLKG